MAFFMPKEMPGVARSTKPQNREPLARAGTDGIKPKSLHNSDERKRLAHFLNVST